MFMVEKEGNMRFIITCILGVFLSTTMFAQKGQTKKPFLFRQAYKNSVGLGAGIYNFNDAQEFIGLLNYAPQLDLTNRHSDLSLSLNTQLSAGYHVKSANDSMAFFYTDVPLLLQVNIGHLASRDFYSEFGVFFGMGYDWNYHRNNLQDGMAITAGLRTWVGSKSFTIRYLYCDFLSIENPVHTITLNMNLGDYLPYVKANNKISKFVRQYKGF